MRMCGKHLEQYMSDTADLEALDIITKSAIKNSNRATQEWTLMGLYLTVMYGCFNIGSSVATNVAH